MTVPTFASESTEARALTALEAWPEVGEEPVLVPIAAGLINVTFRVETVRGARFALQRLAPIFGREVHRDIDKVTRHLEERGMPTPRLIPTVEGELDVVLGQNGGIWRLMTWMEGLCYDRLTGAPLAQAAGALLGRFHVSLSDYRAPFAHGRLGVHDTEAHLGRLRTVLDEKRQRPDYGLVAPLGEAILKAADRLPALPKTPERVVHGDPKVSNLVFNPDGTGRALIDLDTLARMQLHLELGDAFRSWCNRSGEDAQSSRFDLDLFEAAVSGYAQVTHETVTIEERDALVLGARTIMVELASRFCRDALEDCYFGWDPARYPSRSVHNRVRAEGQLALALDLEKRAAHAEQIVRRAFRSAG